MLTLTKFSDISEAIVGDMIIYTIRVNNTSGYLLTSVVVKDLLSPDLDFIEGSIEVDGFAKPTDNILAGVEVGPIGIGNIVDVTFKAKVVGRTGPTTSNQGTVVYTYTDPLDSLVKVETEQTNVLDIIVEVAEVELEKVANVTEVTLGSVIEYQVTVTNTGTIEATNIIFKDVLPDSVVLISDSVLVDGVAVIDPDLEAGINIGSLLPGEESIITYSVTVTGGSCSGYITNSAYTIYNYVLSNMVTGIKESEKVSTSIKVSVTSFKQMTINKYFAVPCQKPDIEEVDDVVVDISIDDSYVVETYHTTSNEGQKLSGYKLIVHGRIQMSMEYTALLPDQPMHSAHCSTPFSTFIILPVDYNGQEIDVTAILEDVSIDQIDLRGADVGIVFLIVAQIK